MGTDGNTLTFDPHPTDDHGNPRSLNVNSLKVTDRFLTARPGATFTGGDTALARFAPDVVEMGLPPKPCIDRNPYNFVPWLSAQPSKAQEPERAKHDRIAAGRLSGRIAVTFTAGTPIFVPEGQLRKDKSHDGLSEGETLDFFRCWDGSCERHAIPGASVKGAVRSLFEALTNSTAGVTDDSALGGLGGGEDGADRYCGPLYRRRATRLFQVISIPQGTRHGKVRECMYVWYGNDGRPRRESRGYDHNRTATTDRNWHANLFWVEPDKHCHGRTLKYYLDNSCFDLKDETLKQFKSMEGHPHLERHGGTTGNASGAPRRMYRGTAPDYSQIKDALFALGPGDLIFGIPKANALHCFGKNVNFLWPGASSPLEMMARPPYGSDRGPFAARRPDQQQLADSDPAEATFGFAGRHTGRSHPFRGRVRFGTFWLQSDDTEPEPADLQLMPLTAPSGTKAKARPLYLEGRSDEKSADFDGAARLRGRKFYWHQQGIDKSNVPGVHDLEKLSAAVPGTWREEVQSQLPAKIRPLPVGSRFAGTLHFTNLTEAELGALLVSVKPDLAFGSEESTASAATESPGYGIKLGKGKPRGLGSVTASIELELATPPCERYRHLEAPLPEGGTDATGYVNAYKAWCVHAQGDGAPTAKWGDLDMAKALKALLQIPKETSVRVYPPQFAMYGWLPDLNKPDGEPRGQRPKAMTPAYEMKGP